LVGGLCTYLATRDVARAQERAAELRAQTDLQLQTERLKHEAVSTELTVRRAKLEDLYVFVSDVAAQCSQTRAQLDYQMGRNLKEHEARWTALDVRLHQARATAAIYFPDLSEGMARVAGSLNMFNWENREFLQTDHDPLGSNERWQIRYQQIIKTSKEAGAAVQEVKQAIAKEAEHLGAGRHPAAEFASMETPGAGGAVRDRAWR